MKMFSLDPPSKGYDDRVLYGQRKQVANYDPNCVVHGTFAYKQRWNIKNLIDLSKPVKKMLEALSIKHALPVQRNCWPQMHMSKIPFICTSPPTSGKTYAYLLYIISKHIIDTETEPGSTDQPLLATKTLTRADVEIDADVDQDNFDYNSLGNEEVKKPAKEPEVNPEDYIMHPKYLIICSSQQQVEEVMRDIREIKAAVYGRELTDELTPTVRSIDTGKSDEKLAIRCNESEILLGTPSAMVKCFELDYLTFAKCKKVFFDDLDVTLQLQNASVRQLIKRFLVQTVDLDSCQMCLFSRKWTELVRQFVGSVFLQMTLIFGSLVEAALHANLRCELEVFTDIESKVAKLANLVRLAQGRDPKQRPKTAIICKSDNEAERVFQALAKLNLETTLMQEDDAFQVLIAKNSRSSIYVLSDTALDFILEHLNDVRHIIHFSLPREIIVFDQRFRSMFEHIKNVERNLTSTIFLNQANLRHPKELYDMFCRSNTTLKSTKLQLRDIISESSTRICWRWATTGLCRLEKLSRDDRFGSYCPDRHSITKKPGSSLETPVEVAAARRWPSTGQVKITITHLVSPSEFYFWFEAHRNIESKNKQWKRLESTGREFMEDLQVKLDKFKDTDSFSVPMEKFELGKIYGVYLQQEARVDRIVLLEKPYVKHADRKEEQANGAGDPKTGPPKISRLQRQRLDYSKQCQVLRVDYGMRMSIYLRNIFELPPAISSIEPMCYRGFHLGYKPTENEPHWNYKAKKHFHESVCVNNLHHITAWLRLNSNKCFWFENMVVVRKLRNIDSNRIYRVEPHRELSKVGLAERITTEPSCLNISTRLETESKWHVDEAASSAQRAFLGSGTVHQYIDIFILQIKPNLDLIVRQANFNKQLLRLEDSMKDAYDAGRLDALNYIAKDVYCLVRLREGTDPQTNKPNYTINRGIIVDFDGDSYLVYCLDHGDRFTANKTDLFHAETDYLTQLPLQAIECKLADYDLEVPVDKTRDLLYSYTRDSNDDLVRLKCSFNGERGIYVYVPNGESRYESLIALLEAQDIKPCSNADSALRRPIFFNTVDPDQLATTVNVMITEILKDLIKMELKEALLENDQT